MEKDDAPFGVIYKTMIEIIKTTLIIIISCAIKSSLVLAEVYGGSYWEVIGLGNMQCEEFAAKAKNESYRELGAVWLSGFMSGVNFTSVDVYDITWSEDLYVLTDLVIKRCGEQPEKLLSDVATEMVYTRYQDNNFTATKDVKK
ncbi:MAG: hypothetical protein P8X88_03875 [Gammaproteobacteria bacterium]